MLFRSYLALELLGPFRVLYRMRLAHLPRRPSLYIRLPSRTQLRVLVWVRALPRVLALALVLVLVLGLGQASTETHHPTGSLGFVSRPYNLQLHH